MARQRISDNFHHSQQPRLRQKKRHPARQRLPRRRHPSTSAPLLEKEVLAFMHTHRIPLSLQDITRGLNLKDTLRKQLLETLANLCHREILTCSRKKLYELRSAANIVEGVVEMHPRGFGFAILDNPPPELQKPGEKNDPFLSPSHLATANHGDRVLLEIIKGRRGKPEARVLQVLERTTTKLVGLFRAGRDTGSVQPEDERFAYTIIIHRENFSGAKNGDAVLTEITDFGTGQRNPLGRIVKVLGNPEDITVQTMMVASKFDLPLEFSPNTLRYTEKLSAELPPDPARQDLSQVAHVTIDGETAKDFDDAVAILRTQKGYRLYVSIADVSHYVQPGTPLDNEAYERGTSVYFPTMVLPMLPERLSNNLCSLVPNEKRPAFTAVLDFDRRGKRVAKKFFKSIIVSRHRLTYTLVKKIVADEDRRLRQEYSTITPDLLIMAELAGELEQQRLKRGSIGFSLPEAELVLNDSGQVTAVNRAERNLAHKLIEEFMLAANEAVAATFAEKNIPALYRIHEQPDGLKVKEFTKFANTLGLALPKNSGSPQWFGQVLTLVAGTPKEYIVNNLLLRTMQRARYSPENTGHFGLAATHYTHFTSPIRRYPDLMVHRALTTLLSGPGGKKSNTGQSLTEAGDFLSEREKKSTQAEWEMTDRLKVRFMADKVGESFAGVVSGVTDFGLFVELLDWFIGGAVAINDLEDDHYFFDEKNHRLTGRRAGRTYQLGDLIRVKVKSVEIQQRRINFVVDQDTQKK